ncbi:MAG TPA: response regulator transcription factor, partial [Chloroflexota bacterium]|nr:response regulator transcription factor [Chloroflexota bacterium]
MSPQPGAHILVADDEPAIARAIRTNLTRHGFHVDVAENAAQALERYTADRPDLLLLDLGLPDKDGLAVIREIRAHSNTPIIVLSVRSAEREKVEAFGLGVDDYLTKPFGVDELLARVRVALRHAVRPVRGTEAVFRTGDLEVDVEHRRVRMADQDVHLSPTEYALLKV